MDYRRAKMVDGLTAVKAVERAGGERKKASGKKAPPPAGDKVEPRKPGMHISRTARPTTYEIACYECGYAFQLTGRAQTTFCPKCRTVLELIDYTIDTEWTETLKTGGNITITEEAVVKSGEIIANDIILAGKLEGGKIRASRSLIVRPSAVFGEGDVQARDLQVAQGTTVVFKRKAIFRDVVVEGELRGRIHCSGLVTVKAGGLLRGDIYSQRLAVEEGGGLKAKLCIQASELAPAADDDHELLEQSA